MYLIVLVLLSVYQCIFFNLLSSPFVLNCKFKLCYITEKNCCAMNFISTCIIESYMPENFTALSCFVMPLDVILDTISSLFITIFYMNLLYF